MPPEEHDFLISHTAHDYDHLIERWRLVAAESGLTMIPFATAHEFEVFALRGTSDSGGFYLSAGIHGDEPAGTLGLIEWAEDNLDFLARSSCLLFPCLNPWGLTHNRRHNGDGEDLNRAFGDPSHPFIAAWTEIVGHSSFDLGICLHEDYDARGCYVYELSDVTPSLGQICLNAVETIIPRDPGHAIEGRPAQGALIRHDGDVAELAREIQEEEGGLPEAIQISLRMTPAALTFETPSEYSLFSRVRAQVRFLETAVAETSGRPIQKRP